MTEAVIVSTARTPLTKSWKGAFNMTHGATMAGHVIKAAVERAKLEPGADDVPGHGRAVSHVERALPRLGERRARGGDDDGFGHGLLPLLCFRFRFGFR